jgi:hypothetical protein
LSTLSIKVRVQKKEVIENYVDWCENRLLMRWRPKDTSTSSKSFIANKLFKEGGWDPTVRLKPDILQTLYTRVHRYYTGVYRRDDIHKSIGRDIVLDNPSSWPCYYIYTAKAPASSVCTHSSSPGFFSLQCCLPHLSTGQYHGNTLGLMWFLLDVFLLFFGASSPKMGSPPMV